MEPISFPRTRFYLPLLVALTAIFGLGGCESLPKPESGRSADSSAALSDAVLIRTTEGDEEIFSAGAKLPVTFSGRFAAETGDSDSASISISQRSPGGNEIIAEVDIPLPVEKGEYNVVVTVRIDEARSLYVKSSVMESGSVKEFGPFPVK